ncbi:MAG: ABC transporter permease, partial [Alphaproteobacteria bacterium]
MADVSVSANATGASAGDPPALDPARALGPSPTARFFRRARGHTSVMFGGGVLLLIVLMAAFAPLIAPHDPYEQDLFKRLLPPFWMEGTDPAHLFGTDQLGRDYLSRIIYGAQISLLIGVATALISGIIGCALGVTAGYFGGRVDAVITFVITTRLSMPIVLVALAIVALVGGSLETVVLVLGLLLWDRYAVVMRSA